MAKTRVLTVDAQAPDRNVIRDAATVLRAGGLIAFPTETVYGLGAHALDRDAVARIFVAKGRPTTDPVIVHLAHVGQLEGVAQDVPTTVAQLAAAFWPGALTLILRKTTSVPDLVTAGLPTVGVRVPSHPVAHALLEASAVPIAAPSANRFSRPSPTTADHVLTDLGGAIDVIIDAGPTPIGLESTILDLTVAPPVLRRPGGISLRAIKEIVPDAVSITELGTLDSKLRAPGQLLRHYAPAVPLTLYVGATETLTERLARDIRAAVAGGEKVGVLAPAEDLSALAPRVAAIAGTGRMLTMRYGSRLDLADAAKELFAALRALDASDVNVIFAVASDVGDLSEAIVDRLTRSAEGRVVRVT